MSGTQDGASLIAAERRRQVEEEGWSPEHDAAHQSDDLALAAVSYALPVRLRPWPSPPRFWPWRFAWKPTPDDRVRELVKAGALIAAEIDRLCGARPDQPEGQREKCAVCGRAYVLVDGHLPQHDDHSRDAVVYPTARPCAGSGMLPETRRRGISGADPDQPEDPTAQTRAVDPAPLTDVSPALLEVLRRAGDEWGPLGVAKTAVALVGHGYRLIEEA